MTKRNHPPVINFPARAAHGLALALSRVDGHGPPLHAGKPHAHGFFSLLYVRAGRGVMSYGPHSLSLRSGSLVITPPGMIHDACGLIGVDRWALEFAADAVGAEGASWVLPRPTRPEWAALRRSSSSALPLSVPANERMDWHRRLAAIDRELSRREYGFRDAVRAHLKLLLIDAARLARSPEMPEARAPLLEEVFDVIEARFARGLSLREVARAVARSPAHLTTVIREQTGLTVQQWIIERRMAEARQRLFASDENILVVAERAGYADAALFIRHFKRAHGVTPKAWRRSATVTER